jgi:alanine racemase
MQFSDLEDITNGKILRLSRDQEITVLITDSRKAVVTRGALFFAIAGANHDGHEFISTLYSQGIRQFIVERPVADIGPEANVLLTNSSLHALQDMAAHHRKQLNAPVIGITGSNGKTIVKEWLFQLLSPEFKIAKNPASYNSQLGVPLSVWQMERHHTLGIFEAGVSTVDEMDYLARIVRPTAGIFTNIGPAHDEGFNNTEEKINEKLKLFRDAERVIYCKDHLPIDKAIREKRIPSLAWGEDESADIRVTRQGKGYRVTMPPVEFYLELPFADQASIENCFHCISVLVLFGLSPEKIQSRINSLRAVPMRLELKEGINQCHIIDDTYNNDLAGLQVSLDFLANQNQKQKKRLILSDIHQSGLSDAALSRKISSLISASHINNFIAIGPILSSYRNDFPPESSFYRSTEEFLSDFDFNLLQNEVILIKGARVFTFEKIAQRLQRKVHGTVMEIDLGAVVHNLNYFKSRVKPSTKIMAMVKAFAYGSGTNEIANVLQYHKVDYLGVAYADEGIDLRRNNITLPIMIMNAAEESFESLLEYGLEPEIYNFRILENLGDFLGQRPCKIHIKIDTGMHRLGFDKDQVDALIASLSRLSNLTVASIFSHLAGADEETHDHFSRQQGEQFQATANKIAAALGYKPLYHLVNSAGVLRLPEFHFDMIRLGIGLYGIDPTGGQTDRLTMAASLKTIISQIKHIPAGETVGYGRRGLARTSLTIATIAIGYADGFSRSFSRGVGKVLVNGHQAPVIGNVCMDMTMVDITGIPAREGDEVIVFGKGLPIQELATAINTIPYEILTSASERVKRVFVAESI